LEDVRRIWIDLDNADWIRDSLDMPGCRIVLRVDRQIRTTAGEEISRDVRYFVSSLDPDQVTAADLLRFVRGHWSIENCLHFVKDRWWDEDRHHTRRPGLSACLAAINNAALTIHRLCGDAKIPVRAAADRIAWQPELGLELLNS